MFFVEEETEGEGGCGELARFVRASINHMRAYDRGGDRGLCVLRGCYLYVNAVLLERLINSIIIIIITRALLICKVLSNRGTDQGTKFRHFLLQSTCTC